MAELLTPAQLQTGLAVTLRALLDEHRWTVAQLLDRTSVSKRMVLALLNAERPCTHHELLSLATAFTLRVGELHETVARAARVPVTLAPYRTPPAIRSHVAQVQAAATLAAKAVPEGPPRCARCGRAQFRIPGRTGRPPKLCACTAEASS